MPDERDDAARAENKARMRAWLENLPPDLAEIYQELRRIDPKGQRRES